MANNRTNSGLYVVAMSPPINSLRLVSMGGFNQDYELITMQVDFHGDKTSLSSH